MAHDLMGESDAAGTKAVERFWIEEERPDATTVVLAIHGDADLRGASELDDRLGAVVEEGPSAVVLDLSATTLVDSMTLGVFVRGLKRLRKRGGRLRVVAPRGEILRIFELTLLDRVFDLDRSKEAALAALRGGRSAPVG